jgi:N-acetylneuraminate lyase
MAAFERGDLPAARAEQLKSLAFVRICASFGYARAAKAAMSFLGVDCGPVRLPQRPLKPVEISQLREELFKAGFPAWSS